MRDDQARVCVERDDAQRKLGEQHGEVSELCVQDEQARLVASEIEGAAAVAGPVRDEHVPTSDRGATRRSSRSGRAPCGVEPREGCARRSLTARTARRSPAGIVQFARRAREDLPRSATRSAAKDQRALGGVEPGAGRARSRCERDLDGARQEFSGGAATSHAQSIHRAGRGRASRCPTARRPCARPRSPWKRRRTNFIAPSRRPRRGGRGA